MPFHYKDVGRPECDFEDDIPKPAPLSVVDGCWNYPCRRRSSVLWRRRRARHLVYGGQELISFCAGVSSSASSVGGSSSWDESGASSYRVLVSAGCHARSCSLRILQWFHAWPELQLACDTHHLVRRCPSLSYSSEFYQALHSGSPKARQGGSASLTLLFSSKFQ
jgi:hypothetical protein